MKNDLTYMYDNSYKRELENKINKTQVSERISKEKHIKQGVILPTKTDSNNVDWGLGGVIDQEGIYVRESGIDNHFGGSYSINEDIEYIDETVIYISVIPKHWGHFLMDVVGRLWSCIDSENNYRIAYNTWGFGGKDINGSYLELFELLGIDKDRLIHINRPMRFAKIIIPENTNSSAISDNDCYKCTRKYKEIISKVVTAVDEMQLDFPKYEKIYFTRTALKKAKLLDVGEKEIKNFFELNGYKSLSPETISLKEQIHYIRNCKVLASISGSIAHNVMFAKEDIKFIILNRTGMTNISQIRINELFDVNAIYIDAYNPKTRDNDYAVGPFWMEINNNIKRFAKENEMKYADTKYTKRIVNEIKFLGLNIMKTNIMNKLKRLIRKMIKA